MSRLPSGCSAERAVDFNGMRCAACGTQWENDDPEPPPCRTGVRALAPLVVQGEPVVARVDLAGVPVTPPPELVERMVAAYEAWRNTGLDGRQRGMRAAWRMFLDEVGQ